MRSFALLPLLVIALSAGQACAPIAGDACEVSSDCGRSMFCELSLPDGYCTLENCDNRTCPGGGVCIRFDENISWCMQPCESKSDCRDGYACVEDFGTYSFCNDARGAAQ